MAIWIDDVTELEELFRAGFIGADGSPVDDDVPAEPQWVLDAAEERWREELAYAARAVPDGPHAAPHIPGVGGLVRSATAALACFNPDVLAGGACGDGAEPAVLLDGIVAAQRAINHLQAVQQRWLVAFARPGVAVPMSELLDAMDDSLGAAIMAAATDGAGEGAGAGSGGGAGAGAVHADGGDDAGDATDGATGAEALLSRAEWASVLADSAEGLASAEVACALGWAPNTARTRLWKAREMVEDLPATLAAQQRGDLDGYRASIIADRTRVLPADLRRRVEERTLPAATSRRTGAALKRLIDREVIVADPEAAARRASAAVRRRDVTVQPDEDDMAVFRALLAAPDAELAHGVLDAIAAGLRSAGAGDGRDRGQLRADAFTDLFRSLADTGRAYIVDTDAASDDTESCSNVPVDTEPGATPPEATRPSVAGPDLREHGPGETGAAERGLTETSAPPRHAAETCIHGTPAADSAASRPEPPTSGSTRHNRSRTSGQSRSIALNVYLDAATLAGLDDQPGELAGHGAITAATARALAESADTVRAIIVRPPGPDRACGTVLDAGRAVYRPPARTADYVTARDRTCQFPGCRAPAHRCDLDHRQAWDDGGHTCPHNLDALCRAHHRLKTFTAWQADPRADGSLVWTSPTGRRFPSEPAPPAGPPVPARPSGRAVPPRPADANMPADANLPDSAADPPPF